MGAILTEIFTESGRCTSGQLLSRCCAWGCGRGQISGTVGVFLWKPWGQSYWQWEPYASCDLKFTIVRDTSERTAQTALGAVGLPWCGAQFIPVHPEPGSTCPLPRVAWSEGRLTHRYAHLARDFSRKGCFSRFMLMLFNWEENVSPVDGVHRNHFFWQEHRRMRLAFYSWGLRAA